MARGVNKAILIGNLGNDPEVRYTQAGAAVANFSIATSETWKDKQTGQAQERTEWHRCVAFGKLGEICGEYLRKGAKIYVEGSIRTRTWQAQDGSDRYSTEIVVGDMQMLDSRGAPGAAERDSGASGGQRTGQTPQSPQGAAPSPQGRNPAFEDFDDDIPF